MKSMGFRGGIHPLDKKDLTKDLPIEDMPIPSRVVIPVVQHIGAPCKAIVSIGEDVKKGQKIGEGTSFVSAPVYASISGKVTAIAPFPHPSGTDILSVVIESDGKDEWIDGLVEREKYLDSDAEELRKIVSEAGIVGLGGATFPTHVKLSPPKDKTITDIILNGAECEPYLTSDYRIMLEMAEYVVGGLKILMKILGVKRGYIAIEDNKPEAIDIMKGVVKGISGEKGLNIDVVELATKYPQGGEKQLIKSVLDREVPSGRLPMDVGVVVQNVGTAASIYNAVRYGRPLIDRVVTVTGLGIKRRANLRVRIGTMALDIIEECGGFDGDIGKVIFGGPMMGRAQYTLNTPVVKGTSGILTLKREETVFNEGNACIRCGKCVMACPMGLMPNMISMYGELKLFDEAEKYNPFDCIECGCCEYECPSKRPTVHLIKYVKSMLLAKKKSKVGK